jgi:hypothetical protein
MLKPVENGNKKFCNRRKMLSKCNKLCSKAQNVVAIFLLKKRFVNSDWWLVF